LTWAAGELSLMPVAALPQIKNGRADLPVSPNIRDSQQHVAPGQPFCRWLFAQPSTI
jgi:hypothetical protein